MRPILLALALLAILVGCQQRPGGVTTRQEFKTFDKSADEGYSVMMPGTPQMRMSNNFMAPTTIYYADNPQVRYETHSAKVQVLGINTGAEPKAPEIAKMLRESRDRFLKEIKATETYTTDTDLGSLVGIEFGAKLPDGPDAVLRGRIYYQDWRVYGILAYGDKTVVYGPDSATFFNSYKIVPKQKPAPKMKK